MPFSDQWRAWFITILKNPLFLQIAPLAVLILLPTLVFFVSTSAWLESLIRSLAMGLEGLGSILPWNWSSGGTSHAGPSSRSSHDRRKSKKAMRTRAEQGTMNGTANPEYEKREDDGYYPGLVNISGTYCFMNSTLQALASLSYLQPHIDAIHAKAEALDVPTPVIDVLQDLLYKLNDPRTSYHSIRPIDIIEVLSNRSEGRTNSLFHSREHQDAQELFQLISECIKNEIAAVDKEGYRDRGLGGLAEKSTLTKEIGKSIFDGLTANRRSCVVCGYTEAVMHFSLDNWQLAVPRLAASCHLEECLEEYTSLEVLHDCICRKCSLLATHRRLLNDINVLQEATKPEAKPSASKKRRLKEVYKMEKRVKAAIEEGRIEDDIPDVRLEKVFSKASTKQAMIARPPPVLALHINRSISYGHYASKNNVRLIFPEVLDLTPFTTSGSLSVVPTSSISTPPPPLHRSTTPTPASYQTPRTIYCLSAVVCHYGQHSFGHYICFRRKPRSPNLGANTRWAPPKMKMADPIRIDEDGNSLEPTYVWEEDGEEVSYREPPGKGWLRISDDSVRECGIESVLAEGTGAFMLFYERVVVSQPGIYPPGSESNVSEETLKPQIRSLDLNGSVGSLVSEVGFGVYKSSPIQIPGREPTNANGHAHPEIAAPRPMMPMSVSAPRVVRNVATRRRSLSVSSTQLTGSLEGMSTSATDSVLQLSSGSLPNGLSHPLVNGTLSQSHPEPTSLPTSASSPLPPRQPLSASSPPTQSYPTSAPSTPAPSTSSTSTSSSSKSPSKRTKAPKPPAGPSVIGLKA